MSTARAAAASGGPRAEAREARVHGLVQAVAGVVLVVAAAVLPWVSYSGGLPRVASSLHGGSMGLLLGLAGAAAAVLGVAAARRPVRWIFGASVGLGAIAIVGSVVLALGKMADANGIHHSGPWQTSYASGAVLGVLASFVILVAASIGLTSGR